MYHNFATTKTLMNTQIEKILDSVIYLQTFNLCVAEVKYLHYEVF